VSNAPAEHGTGAGDGFAIRSSVFVGLEPRSGTFGKLDVPVEELVLGEKWKRASRRGAAEFEAVVRRVDVGAGPRTAGPESSGSARLRLASSSGRLGSAPFISAKRVAFQILLTKLRLPSTHSSDSGTSPPGLAARARVQRSASVP